MAELSAAPDPARCPLCGEANGCAMASGATDAPCWCARTVIPASVLERVPPEARNKACVCARCAERG